MPETGAVLRTKNGNASSSRPPGASSRATSASTQRAQRRDADRLGARHRALLEQRDQPRHVRALAIRRQRDEHAAVRDRRLDAVAIGDRQRIAKPADADLVDRELAMIGRGLHVRHRQELRQRLGTVHGAIIA